MAQSGADVPDPVTGLTSRERELIKNSWAVLRKNPTESGIALFNVFFKNNPDYKQVFPFRDVATEDLPKNKRFLAHANSVIYAFSSIVDAIDDPELLASILDRIGESHIPRKIPENSFNNLKVSVLELFSSVFNEDEVAAWTKALDVAFALILQGFN